MCPTGERLTVHSLSNNTGSTLVACFQLLLLSYPRTRIIYAYSSKIVQTYKYIYISYAPDLLTHTPYIYIIVEKSPNSSHMYDHGFMDNTNRQAVKNCKFVNLQNGCLHDVRDASLVCESSQFLTAWRLVLSMKPWSYIWLEFGLFQQL